MSGPHCSRRTMLAAGLVAATGAVSASDAPMRALRQMEIHRVKELGLMIWVENQPTWEAGLQRVAGRPRFVVQSPDNYHPPAVLQYSSWPDERVHQQQLSAMAQGALKNAARGFGLGLSQIRALPLEQASHRMLQGWQCQFEAKVQGVDMDVRVFVGQGEPNGPHPRPFPVALSAYTLLGRMGHLQEVLRRAWTRVDYL